MKKIIYLIISVVTFLTIAYAMPGLQKDSDSACSATAVEFKSIDPEKIVILDVRTAAEFNSGHIAGAMLIDIYKKDFQQLINSLDKEKTYYVYCKTGMRSAKATRFMEQSGFRNVCNIEGGLNQLKRAGIPLVK